MKLRISRLMDDYQDDEFFPEDGPAADLRAVKDRVLAQASPAKKRRIPPLKAALLAAALAVGCVLMIAAALPAQIFDLASGGTAVFQRVTDDYSTMTISGEMPLTLKDGRLWLDINGGYTDITDQIDWDTPYIYDNTSADTGRFDYLVVGGTPEDYGWIEFYELEDGSYAAAGENFNQTCCEIEGTVYDYINDLTDEQRAQIDQQSIYYTWKPWYLNAIGPLAELGISALH